MVYTLGKDTTMAGAFQINNNQFYLRVVSRPSIQMTELKGELYPNGELKWAKGYTMNPISPLGTVTAIDLSSRNDSIILQHKTGTRAVIQKFKGTCMTANAIGSPFRFLLAFWPKFAPGKIGDSVTSNHLSMGAMKKLILKRTGENKITGGSSAMGMLTIYHNSRGDLDSIDAIGSTWNVTGKVVGQMDLDAMAQRFYEEDQKSSMVISVQDSVVTETCDATIKVDYSRPKMRGRTIFGAVVPYDRTWRTGANAATTIFSDKPLSFSGKILPAGTYSLWTIPSKEGWTLIFNSRANAWGTEHDPSLDVLKVPMLTQTLTDNVELMTIEVKPNNLGGELNIMWEKTKATVSFAIQQSDL